MPERLVVGAGDVERQAVLVDGEAREFRVHGLAHRREGLLQRAPAGDRELGRAVERR